MKMTDDKIKYSEEFDRLEKHGYFSEYIHVKDGFIKPIFTLEWALKNFPQKGDKIIYNGEHGWEVEKRHASTYLRHGAIYTIKSVSIHRSVSFYRLEEIEGKEFNTCMFEKVEK